MARTAHEADLINADRRAMAELMHGRLAKMGVQVSVATFTGDSSYPTEYALCYGLIRASGPTMDLAVMEFLEKLLRSEKAGAYQSMEAALQVLTGTILNLRTELL